MLFNSKEFLFVFFPIVTLLYFLLPQRPRMLFLLAASCWFYMAFVPYYILILLFTVTIDYLAGIGMENASGRHTKRWLLLASISSNVLILGFFKYFNFFSGNVNALADWLGLSAHVPALSIILPIGLSFHTFQAMSYTIEVYRGKQAAEHNYFTFALYVMFYPQLVAGPIERPQNMIPQFYKVHSFSWENIVQGAKWMLIGYFKKVVVADRLAEYVNAVYNHPGDYFGLPVILATFFFALQIYCDFSGYSDIALGTARIMGIQLMQNFNSPYAATNIVDFWRRWHISLSTWFRDYVYIPLGGNRAGKLKYYRNILVVFLLSGLWHGANWTFVVWGLLHGLYTIGYTALLPPIHRIRTWITSPWAGAVVNTGAAVVTFVMVSFAWIFFRASSLATAWQLIRQGVQWGNHSWVVEADQIVYKMTIMVFVILMLMAYELYRNNALGMRTRLKRAPRTIRYVAYAAVILTILQFGVYSSSESFIYFQF